MSANRKAINLYLTIIMTVTFGLGILELIFQTGQFFSVLQIGFTVFPVATAFIVRRIMKEKSRFKLSLKVWKNWKMWLFCAFVPAIAIALGAVLYFVIFKNEYSGVFQFGQLYGSDMSMEITSPLSFVLVCVLIAAVCVPIQLLELGEEIGWRGFLLWRQVELYGEKKAVLINGFEWGLAHMPLIFFGFNYSSENFGAPWTNMALMLLDCIAMGVVFSYVTLKTKNCMYSAIMHGAVNVIGEFPVFCSISLKSGLLGPNPTGLISMIFLVLLAVVLYVKLCKRSVVENDSLDVENKEQRIEASSETK